jgi:hypothetical protein
MAGFDPDAYLASAPSPQPAPPPDSSSTSDNFDPDAYLANTEPPKPSVWDQTKLAAKMLPLAAENSPTGFMGGSGGSSGGFVGQGLDAAGQGTANILGKAGYPKAGAVLGTGISLAQPILGAATSLSSVMGDSPIAQAIQNTPKDLGPRYQQLDQVAGISSDLPIQAGKAAKYPPPDLGPLASKAPRPVLSAEPLPSTTPQSYARDPSSFLNQASQRVNTFGDRLTPQELHDYKTILTNQINGGDVAPGTQAYAMAVKLRGQVSDLLNNAVPGRQELNQIYGYAKTIHEDLPAYLAKGIKEFGKASIVGALGYGGWKAASSIVGSP